MMRHFAILAALCLVFAMANKNVATQPEGVVVSDQEILARAQAQLLGAMALLETLDNKQELTEGEPITAEKRRNKFEFIRFGRK
ncbi:flp-12 [Pristionchus pacificus]|uniref:Flp-12 n=1 Tax=Pristionchus pacificus TaxID=54126 RepID=A0A2A6D1U8_PRIPA|nr:flp-12 [Pristionchus pacificus]|eukprot:PDM84326.1 flp-12 [Pristionchus pacificus]